MTSAYEQNRLNLNNSRNIDPNRFKDQMNTVKKIINPEDPTFISELFLDLKTGYSTFKSVPGGPYIKGGSALGAIGLRRLIKKANIPQKVYTNFNDLRKLSEIGERLERQVPNFKTADTGVVQFVNQGEDVSNMFTPNSLSYKKTVREFNEGIPTGQAKKDAVLRHLQAIDEGRPIPYFRDTKTGKIKYLDNKGVDAKTGEISYMMRDVTLKRKDSSFRRAAEKAKTIPLQDYIDELGEALGRKGYDLDQKRFERLYRWVGKNVHVDHMNPLMGEGFHHPSNLILLKAQDNLKKGKKLLPDEFFAQMEIPLTKRDLIRSSIQNPKYSNKVKRRKILETLNIVNK